MVFNQNNTRLTRNEGAIEYCRLNNITLQAWSPLAQGRLTGGQPRPKDGKHIQKTAGLVKRMAAEKGVRPEAILIAWILRHPAGIQPLPGTINPERLLAACEGEQITIRKDQEKFL